MSGADKGYLRSGIKAIAFLAWSLNAALDEAGGEHKLSVERLERCIGSGEFLHAVQMLDTMDAVAMLDPATRDAVNSRVLELWEVRGWKYAGAKNSSGHIAMGFILTVLSELVGPEI
jgi:hypothetical protein